MKNYTKTKTFPIIAGMQFTYPGTTKDKLHKVGYYRVRFTFTHDHLLIKEETIKRVMY